MTRATGEEITSSTLRLDAQEVSWTDARAGEPQSAPLDAVQAMRVRNRRSVVLRDLGIGPATGGVAGLAMESLAEPNIAFSRPDLRMMGLSSRALVGTGVGALVANERGRTVHVPSTGFASARPSSVGG